MQNLNRELESLNVAPALPTVNSYKYLSVAKAETNPSNSSKKHIVKRQSANTANEHFLESEMTKS